MASDESTTCNAANSASPPFMLCYIKHEAERVPSVQSCHACTAPLRNDSLTWLRPSRKPILPLKPIPSRQCHQKRRSSTTQATSWSMDAASPQCPNNQILLQMTEVRHIKTTFHQIGFMQIVSVNDRKCGNYLFYKYPSDVLAVLHNHSALAGLLDAEERFDAPKCDPATRLGIIERLTNWVESKGQSSPSSLLWLHGPAGVGKSALMQQLGLLMQEQGNHAASFFFSRTAVGRNDGNSLIITLAYQLAMNFPPIRAHIANNLNQNPGIFSLSNKMKMKLLVIDPINNLRTTSFWKRFRKHFSRSQTTMQIPRLVVVDGLDESDNKDIQSDILLIIAHAIYQLRLPLRFIIASRPEAHILTTFNNSIFDKISYTCINLGEDAEAKHDVLLFLTKEFRKIRTDHPLGQYLPDPWPTSAQMETLVMKSSRGFIYPATVLKYIKSPYLKPDECLKVILGLSSIPTSDRPYAQLDDLYFYIFNSAHKAHKPSVKLIFSVLAIPATEHDLTTSPNVLDKYLSFSQGHVRQVLQNFLSLVDLREDNEPIKLHHASLSDFLLDPKRSGEFCADLVLAHQALARGYILQLFPASFDHISGSDSFVHSSNLIFYGKALSHCQHAFQKRTPRYKAYAPLDEVHRRVISWTSCLSVYTNPPKIILDASSFENHVIYRKDSYLIPILFETRGRIPQSSQWVYEARRSLVDFFVDRSRSGLNLIPVDLSCLGSDPEDDDDARRLEFIKG